jgi:glycosyltransferase involved in cell wall biosynthesis
MKGRICIIDSGMRNVGGHNFSYTRAVQKELEARGYGVDVLVHRSFPDELARTSGYQPTFEAGAYDFGPDSGLIAQMKFFRHRSRIFAAELSSALRELDANRYALLFSHTLNDFELMGWRDVATDLPASARVMLLLRNTPRFLHVSRMKLALHPYWRIKPQSLRAIHGALGSRFTLATDSELLTEDYASIFAGKIVTLPIPINAHVLGLSPPAVQTRHSPITLGYLGDARASKGFPLLPSLVRALTDKFGDRVRFRIQCPPSASGTEAAIPEGLAELRAIASAVPDRLTLIEEKLSEEDYAALMGSLDIVLIPYRVHGYVEPTSGIFAEAAALGKPVVVPGGTWMARELRRYGGGLEFDQSGDDLNAKVSQLLESYDEFRQRAAGFAAQWQTFHNAANVAELILSGSGLSD